MHNDVTEIGPLHLDERVLIHSSEPLLREDSVVLSVSVSTCSSGSLVEVRRSDPSADERGEMPRGIVPLLLDSTGIDDVDDVGDGDGGLGDVGGEDDSSLTVRSWLEDLLLLGDGDGRVKDVDRDGLGVEVVSERSSIGEVGVDFSDGFDSVEEDELRVEKGEKKGTKRRSQRTSFDASPRLAVQGGKRNERTRKRVGRCYSRCDRTRRSGRCAKS